MKRKIDSEESKYEKIKKKNPRKYLKILENNRALISSKLNLNFEFQYEEKNLIIHNGLHIYFGEHIITFYRGRENILVNYDGVYRILGRKIYQAKIGNYKISVKHSGENHLLIIIPYGAFARYAVFPEIIRQSDTANLIKIVKLYKIIKFYPADYLRNFIEKNCPDCSEIFESLIDFPTKNLSKTTIYTVGILSEIEITPHFLETVEIDEASRNIFKDQKIICLNLYMNEIINVVSYYDIVFPYRKIKIFFKESLMFYIFTEHFVIRMERRKSRSETIMLKVFSVSPISEVAREIYRIDTPNFYHNLCLLKQ